MAETETKQEIEKISLTKEQLKKLSSFFKEAYSIGEESVMKILSGKVDWGVKNLNNLIIPEDFLEVSSIMEQIKQNAYEKGQRAKKNLNNLRDEDEKEIMNKYIVLSP